MSSEPRCAETGAGAMDKGKRLAQMMSLGFGYFKAKKALEEHGWDVNDAIASTMKSSAIDKKPSATSGTGTMPTNEAIPASAVPSGTHNENPHLSPEHANVRSLKRETPHSHRHFEQVPDATSSSAVAMKTSDFPLTQAPAKQDPPGHTTNNKGHEYKTDVDESTTQENFGDYVGKQYIAFPNDYVEDIGRNTDLNRLTSTPVAFREGGDENSSEVWDSLIQGAMSTPPYLAVAQTGSVPELVNATVQPPSVISAVTSPIELAQLPPKEGIATSVEEGDKSAVERSYVGPARRRSLCVIAVALLAFIGLVVGLAVSQTPNNESTESVLGRGESPTTSPTTSAPSLATGDTTIHSPTMAPSQSPPAANTPLPTRQPTSLSTIPPTQPPTTSQPAPPTDPPTVPFPSPTVGSTPLPTLSPPTVPPAVTPTSPQPPQEDMRVEEAEMVLSRASRLDQEALSAWIDVTVGFIVAHVAQTIQEETNSPYLVNVGIASVSQTETNDEELTLTFSVNFEIESSLESYNVDEYVLGAFNDKEAYITELQDADSSFDGVLDINISV